MSDWLDKPQQGAHVVSYKFTEWFTQETSSHVIYLVHAIMPTLKASQEAPQALAIVQSLKFGCFFKLKPLELCLVVDREVDVDGNHREDSRRRFAHLP